LADGQGPHGPVEPVVETPGFGEGHSIGVEFGSQLDGPPFDLGHGPDEPGRDHAITMRRR